MKPNKKSQLAVETLIMYVVSLIIVAAALATLLLIINNLGSKTISTERTVQNKVGTNLQVIQIIGTDGSTSHALDNFQMMIKINAGSNPIYLSNFLFTFESDDQVINYKYDPLASCANVTSEYFTVDYSRNGSDHVVGFLSEDDVGMMCFNSPSPIGESERIAFKYYANNLNPFVVEITTPDLINKKFVMIYPMYS
jgi:archaellin